MNYTNLTDLYSFIIATEELKRVMQMSKGQFSRFKKASGLKPFKKFGHYEYFHVDDVEACIRKHTFAYNIVEFIERVKDGRESQKDGA